MVFKKLRELKEIFENLKVQAKAKKYIDVKKAFKKMLEIFDQELKQDSEKILQNLKTNKVKVDTEIALVHKIVKVPLMKVKAKGEIEFLGSVFKPKFNLELKVKKKDYRVSGTVDDLQIENAKDINEYNEALVATILVYTKVLEELKTKYLK